MDPRFIELLRSSLKLAGSDGDGGSDAAVITPDTELRKLGVDSMQAIELLFSIEDTFGISLPDEELNDTTFATAGNLWRAIATQLSDAPGGEATP
ncbi:acyl carrier protein [Streptomyces sp. yr375]|uniref:acyl carrier protein n=1 Tax=Streptomyces sp. yr375 TaxID=1761906 RepID=UPI0008BF28AE|nr:acyl carrier protein [Streptomyces sp. yr375]SER13186.1 acyl carrier protein [Streptomyces sp. yr375]